MASKGKGKAPKKRGDKAAASPAMASRDVQAPADSDASSFGLTIERTDAGRSSAWSPELSEAVIEIKLNLASLSPEQLDALKQLLEESDCQFNILASGKGPKKPT